MSEQERSGYQRFPKWKYHRTGKSVIVQDAEGETALGEGWGDSPGGPSGLPAGSDPLCWFDSWDLQCLSLDGRGRIRAGLAAAHADVIEGSRDDGTRIRQMAMQKAFDLFAKEYMAAGLLTESIMAASIPQKVYDAAVSGGWQTGTLDRNRGCTLQLGHYWVPENVPRCLGELFEAQVWRWRGKLMEAKSHVGETAVPSGLPVGEEPALRTADANPAPRQDNREVRGAARQAVVMPRLKSKRWTRGKWATASGVSKNCVYQYLDGKRKLSEVNRKAMAEVLGVKPEELPE